MKNLILSSVFILLIFANVESLAGTSWSPIAGEVTEVMSHNGYHVIYTTLNDGSCANPGAFYWSIDNPNAQDMFSIALAAMMANKKIMMVDTGASQDCTSYGAAKGTHIRVIK